MAFNKNGATTKLKSMPNELPCGCPATGSGGASYKTMTLPNGARMCRARGKMYKAVWVQIELIEKEM